MELEVLNNFNKVKESKEKLNISFCNEYGQVGLIRDVVVTNVDKINDKITIKMPCKNDLKMEVDFVLGNETKNKMNSFYALVVASSVPKKDESAILYHNPKEKELLHSTKKYSFHMDQSYVDEWKKDKAVDFLLSNIGKYVSIAEGTHRYNGVVKSLNYDAENDITMITLIQSERVLRPHKLSDKCKIVSYANQEALDYKSNKQHKEECEL